MSVWIANYHKTQNYGFQNFSLKVNIKSLLKYKYKLKFLKLILARTVSSHNDTKQLNVHGPFTLIAYMNMYLLHMHTQITCPQLHVHNIHSFTGSFIQSVSYKQMSKLNLQHWNTFINEIRQHINIQKKISKTFHKVKL